MANNLNYSLLRSFLVEQGCEREFMDIFYSQNRCTCFCAGVRDIMGGDEYFLNRAFRWEKTYMQRWNAGRKSSKEA